MNWIDFLSELSWTHYTSLSLCELLYAAYYARAKLRDLAKSKAGLELREGPERQISACHNGIVKYLENSSLMITSLIEEYFIK